MLTLKAGNIYDISKEYVKEYEIIPDFSDEYYFKINEGYISLYLENKPLFEDVLDTKINLEKNKIYNLKVTTIKDSEDFNVTCFPLNNKVVETYPIIFKKGKKGKIDMKPRKGGIYLYNNIPENMQEDVLNTIIMENKNLHGDCFLTFENQNRTGSKIFMGYRLINNNNFDVYVTVTNLGYQTATSWLGDMSWEDYYGIKLPLNLDLFTNDKFIYNGIEYDSFSYEKAYLNFNLDYEPDPVKVSTYRIPPQKYIYIIGGTSEDSFNNINVKTANILVNHGECINGNVKFKIIGGTLKGQLCVYNDISKINDENVKIFEIVKHGEKDDLCGRMGYALNHGVVDNNVYFTFNDKTKEGKLPVHYYNYYSKNSSKTYKVNEKLKFVHKHHYKGDCYKTHLSAELNHDYVGTDLVEQISSYNGKKITLSAYRANPRGIIYDYGNWMIEYQDNQTFINKGKKTRKISHYISNVGSLFYIIKDNQGNILKSGATAETATGLVPIFEFEVLPGSKVTYSIQYVLPANDCGSIIHYNELK